jgi:hypothetical protein
MATNLAMAGLPSDKVSEEAKPEGPQPKGHPSETSDGHLLDFLGFLFRLALTFGAPVLGGVIGYMLNGQEGCYAGVVVGVIILLVFGGASGLSDLLNS